MYTTTSSRLRDQCPAPVCRRSIGPSSSRYTLLAVLVVGGQPVACTREAEPYEDPRERLGWSCPNSAVLRPMAASVKDVSSLKTRGLEN